MPGGGRRLVYGTELAATLLDATELDATLLDATELDTTELDATLLDATELDATLLDALPPDATLLDALSPAGLPPPPCGYFLRLREGGWVGLMGLDGGVTYPLFLSESRSFRISWAMPSRL
jgi:hypothetical protein